MNQIESDFVADMSEEINVKFGQAISRYSLPDGTLPLMRHLFKDAFLCGIEWHQARALALVRSKQDEDDK